MKNYLKHLLCLGTLIAILLTAACSKDNAQRQNNNNQHVADSISTADSLRVVDSLRIVDSIHYAQSDIRNPLVGRFYCQNRYLIYGVQDSFMRFDSLRIAKGPTRYSLILNTDTFAIDSALSNSTYLIDRRNINSPKTLNFYQNFDSVVYRYHDYGGLSHTEYTYLAGHRVP